jgi:hypothetical protein
MMAYWWMVLLLVAGPEVSVIPARPVAGAFVTVVVRGWMAGGLEGWMAGEALHFEMAADSTWRALGGVPAAATDSVEVRLVTTEGERTDSSSHWIRLTATDPPVERLRVDPRYSRPLSKALRARVDRELDSARAVGRRSHDTPQLDAGGFTLPVESRVTSPYGVRREYNGELRSRHLGTDLAGATGTPVRAPARGVVALVGRFYYAGRVVYLDHGRGLTSGYLHLSAVDVAVGDTMERGGLIGKIGATGRVTGPHLHWVARYGVVPLDAMTLVGEVSGKR